MNATQRELARARSRVEAWFSLRAARAVAALPFSFVYGGRPSGQCLPSWTVERSQHRLDAQRDELVLLLADPESGLRLHCIVTLFRDYPALEWVLDLHNEGQADTPIISDLLALDAGLTCGPGECVVHYARGSLCSRDDFAPLRRVLRPGAVLRLQPGGGRSSSEVLPFFNVETRGGGLVAAIGWSGEWAATFIRGDDELRLQAGLAQTHFRLHPGERVRTPRVLLLFWEGGDRWRGQNLLRRFILAHHRPQVAGQPLVAPICAGNWGGTRAEIHLDNVRRIDEERIPVDVYWIDAEWFGQLPWWQHNGDWTVRREVYPEGLRPIGDAVHRTGRRFLLWFEPERVCRGTPWYREHRDWLLTISADDECRSWPHFFDQTDPSWVLRESRRNCIADGDALLDLGNPAARRFLTDFIAARIEEFGLDWYRHDANIAPLEFWRRADAPDRQGITEMHWVEGLYAFWDDLLRRHPGLAIDSCASGGRRIDLETISRSTPLWRTDYPQDPIAKQCHTYGLLAWVPLNATGGLGIAEDDDYTLRSTLSSGLVVRLARDGDEAQEQPLGEDWLAELVRRRLEQVRMLREYFTGDFYPLTEYSQAEDAWMAYQLDRPEEGDGLVAVLKRPLSPFVKARLPLRGLVRTVRYRITNLDGAPEQTRTGAVLCRHGLEVRLARRPDSALFVYRREG